MLFPFLTCKTNIFCEDKVEFFLSCLSNYNVNVFLTNCVKICVRLWMKLLLRALEKSNLTKPSCNYSSNVVISLSQRIKQIHLFKYTKFKQFPAQSVKTTHAWRVYSHRNANNAGPYQLYVIFWCWILWSLRLSTAEYCSNIYVLRSFKTYGHCPPCYVT